jgi:hypothetical protein
VEKCLKVDPKLANTTPFEQNMVGLCPGWPTPQAVSLEKPVDGFPVLLLCPY